MFPTMNEINSEINKLRRQLQETYWARARAELGKCNVYHVGASNTERQKKKTGVVYFSSFWN